MIGEFTDGIKGVDKPDSIGLRQFQLKSVKVNILGKSRVERTDIVLLHTQTFQ